ncbi:MULTISPECIES: peroxiredoxin [Pedobacter]|uniref:peroxiredoxin family protein n=1 Tax=Pedobacter TaxID=84567 RepID=UPI001E368F0B|nr:MULTISPECIES: peroxiredoxin family protein [Pedobacter]
MRICLIVLISLWFSELIAQDAPIKWATQETFFEDLVGKDLPDFKGLKTNKKVFTKQSLDNQVIVINFWFENCSPCIAEMPELNNLVGKYAKQGVRFIGITHDSPLSAKRFQTKNSYKYEIVSLSKADIAKLNINHGFPSNILIGKNGKIITAMANISFTNSEFKAKSIAFEDKIIKAVMQK